jgi:hypothetical protein
MQGLTALGYAVKEGHLDIVMALVDRGASLVSDATLRSLRVRNH